MIGSNPSSPPTQFEEFTAVATDETASANMNTPIATNPFISPLVQGHLDTKNDVVVDKNLVPFISRTVSPALVQGYVGDEDKVVVKTSNLDIHNESDPTHGTAKQAPTPTKGTPKKDYVELLRRRKRELEQVLQSSPLQAAKSQPKGLSRLLGPKEEDDDDGDDGGISFTNFSKASRQYDVHIVSDMSDISCSEFELDADDEIDQDHQTRLHELETYSTAMATPTKQQYGQQTNTVTAAHCDMDAPNRLARIDSLGQSSETSQTNSSDGVTSSDKALALTSKSSNSSGLSYCENDIECPVPSNSASTKNNLELALKKQVSMSFLATDNTTLTADSTATAALRMKRSLMWMVACLSLLVVILVITVSVVTIVALRNRDQHVSNPSNSSLHPPSTSKVTSSTPTATLRHNIFVPAPAPVPPTTRLLRVGLAYPNEKPPRTATKETILLVTRSSVIAEEPSLSTGDRRGPSP